METTVLIQSAPKPKVAFPPTQWCYTYNLIKIGQLASEIFKFESVDDDGRRRRTTTDDGPLVYYKLTLWAWALGSGELKNKGTVQPEQTGLGLTWSQTTKDRFSCNMAHFTMCTSEFLTFLMSQKKNKQAYQEV